MPGPGIPQDAFEGGLRGLPVKALLRQPIARHQSGWITLATRAQLRFEVHAGHLSRGVDHLAHTGTGTGAEVDGLEARLAQDLEGQCMRRGQVGANSTRMIQKIHSERQ